MKTLITFGIALVALTSLNASNFKNSFATVLENEQGDSFTEGTITEKNCGAPVEDRIVMYPETVLASANQNNIAEVIAENNLITESKVEDDGSLLFIEKSTEEIIADNNKVIENVEPEFRPLYLDRTIEDKMAEDRAIIESDQAIEAQPLDFEVINKDQAFKPAANKIIGMN